MATPNPRGLSWACPWAGEKLEVQQDIPSHPPPQKPLKQRKRSPELGRIRIWGAWGLQSSALPSLMNYSGPWPRGRSIMQEAEPGRAQLPADQPREALSESHLSSGRQAALMPRKGASEQFQRLLCLKGPIGCSWADPALEFLPQEREPDAFQLRQAPPSFCLPSLRSGRWRPRRPGVITGAVSRSFHPSSFKTPA